MPTDGVISFGGFRADLAHARLCRGDEEISLRDKAWQVLRYLLIRRGELVGPDELTEAVWPGVYVTPQTLTNVIHELRNVLGETAREPRYLHSVARRGYRFVVPEDPAGNEDRPSHFVGRSEERDLLDRLLGEAMSGRPRLALIGGEPGVGKTALVREYLSRLTEATSAAPRCLWVGCVPDAEESFGPVHKILAELRSGSAREDTLGDWREEAPTWHARFAPSDKSDPTELRRPLVGAGEARLRHEAVRILARLCRAWPHVIVIDDVQWADPATLAFLEEAVMGWPETKLLILATYRSSDAAFGSERLRRLVRETTLRTDRCERIELEPFSPTTIERYLAPLLPEAPIDERLVELITRRSGGNPLFASHLIRECLRTGIVVRRESWQIAEGTDSNVEILPRDLLAMINDQLARLPREQRAVLEAGNLVGETFSEAEAAHDLG